MRSWFKMATSGDSELTSATEHSKVQLLIEQFLVKKSGRLTEQLLNNGRQRQRQRVHSKGLGNNGNPYPQCCQKQEGGRELRGWETDLSVLGHRKKAEV